MNETPISPENVQVFVDGIPDYELGRVIWREIQSYYNPQSGDENSAIERYSERWQLDCNEIRGIVGRRDINGHLTIPLASATTLKNLGLVARAVDGRCPSCRNAITLTHYFLVDQPKGQPQEFPKIWLD